MYRYLFIISTFIILAGSIQINIHLHLEMDNCYQYPNQRNCSAVAGCVWCSSSQWSSCIKEVDNCQCMVILSAKECMINPECKYCNLGPYAGRYCTGKDSVCS